MCLERSFQGHIYVIWNELGKQNKPWESSHLGSRYSWWCRRVSRKQKSILLVSQGHPSSSHREFCCSTSRGDESPHHQAILMEIWCTQAFAISLLVDIVLGLCGSRTRSPFRNSLYMSLRVSHEPPARLPDKLHGHRGNKAPHMKPCCNETYYIALCIYM